MKYQDEYDPFINRNLILCTSDIFVYKSLGDDFFQARDYIPLD